MRIFNAQIIYRRYNNSDDENWVMKGKEGVAGEYKSATVWGTLDHSIPGYNMVSVWGDIGPLNFLPLLAIWFGRGSNEISGICLHILSRGTNWEKLQTNSETYYPCWLSLVQSSQESDGQHRQLNQRHKPDFQALSQDGWCMSTQYPQYHNITCHKHLENSLPPLPSWSWTFAQVWCQCLKCWRGWDWKHWKAPPLLLIQQQEQSSRFNTDNSKIWNMESYPRSLSL